MFKYARTAGKPITSIKCTALMKIAFKDINSDVRSCSDIVVWNPTFTLIHMLLESSAIEVSMGLVIPTGKVSTVEASHHIADNTLLDLI